MNELHCTCPQTEHDNIPAPSNLAHTVHMVCIHGEKDPSAFDQLWSVLPLSGVERHFSGVFALGMKLWAAEARLDREPHLISLRVNMGNPSECEVYNDPEIGPVIAWDRCPHFSKTAPDGVSKIYGWHSHMPVILWAMSALGSELTRDAAEGRSVSGLDIRNMFGGLLGTVD